ncbi:MAG: hypothetical protein A2521_11755 [Deltaproteobacteria bacterium RIFOXYD12_FULL_57_12]|nr:MAG: hypothetical protein A2521_11755 [Deltaproteobacteria bacterium RIFOXYD12_FULL_57_12]
MIFGEVLREYLGCRPDNGPVWDLADSAALSFPGLPEGEDIGTLMSDKVWRSADWRERGAALK